MQELAAAHGIKDIFQDNGGKILQLILALNLKVLPGRNGNDAFDTDKQYELKTLNANLTSGFTTHHHLNGKIIEKYREATWIFAVYEDILLKKVYEIDGFVLNPYFEKWTTMLESRESINNPKIPLKFVEKHGKLIWPMEPQNEQQLF